MLNYQRLIIFIGHMVTAGSIADLTRMLRVSLCAKALRAARGVSVPCEAEVGRTMVERAEGFLHGFAE